MQTQPQNETQDKTPYQTPEIIDFGAIEKTTQVGSAGNTDNDGASGVPI